MDKVKRATIKRKPAEYIGEISEMLSVNGLFEKYPQKSWEAWRRFDPANLLPLMHECVKNGVYNLPLIWKKVKDIEKTSEKNVCENMKIMKEWEKADPAFANKVKDKLSKIKWNDENAFFPSLVEKLSDMSEVPVLRISANEENTAPVHFIYAPKKDIRNFYSNFMIIFAEENSNASVYIESFSEGFCVLDNAVFLEKNANLNLHCLMREGIGSNETKNSAWIWSQNATLDEGSSMLQGFFGAGGKLGKIISETNLNRMSSYRAYGIHVGNHSHIDHDFHINHKESHSRSSLEFNMALLEHAYAVFSANIKIPENTVSCAAHQSNKNIILSENSRADAIPRLEILTEEVEASHGSATGELSDEELFYLTSRGLDEKEAKHLLLLGFFEDILQKSLKHTQDKTAYKDPFLHDIWCAIQDRTQINFDRSFLNTGE
ncbi:MAG: SufD family Fe-S cluster assembly protein [Spirochaetia bacterium]|nr:SufD family Fe-S cluster assembly protein [Spirochaetia bacterium]